LKKERILLTVVGARPQFIKASALSRVLADGQYGWREVLIHTGQHYDKEMSSVFFEELGMRAPDERLALSATGSGERLGEMMEGILRAIETYEPDALLVYGDTDSTLAGALAASRASLPSIHVEAGLRSFNRSMPEEVNRILTDQLATLLFCPSAEAVSHLAAEGRTKGVIRTGDILLDSSSFMRRNMSPAEVQANKTWFMTMHRPYNVDAPDRLECWLRTAGALAREHEAELRLAVHPRTAAVLKESLGENWRDGLSTLGITPLPPLGYRHTMGALNGADLVLTDSGGLQKEAFFFGKPCVVMRTETEWTELIDGGYAVLAPDPELLASATGRVLANERTCDWASTLYGDGKTADQIARTLESWNPELR
jgi:UDP-GlcNAc3NAcA epimerase